jgi:HAD superfamily hydrolase (TIGR01457 family)
VKTKVAAEANSAETVVARLWGQYDTLLADLDGVVYEGTRAIAHAVDSLNKLQANGIAVGYVTNNSSRTPETISAQLNGFGLNTAAEQIIGSAQTGTELLATMVAPGSKILVVGGDGLRSRVASAGFIVVDSADENPAGVIQGFAPEVAWKHLAEAAYAIQAGAKWVATNSDWTLPQERGLAPGNGTLVSAVHTAVGQLPLVAGKPEPAIFQTALRQFNTNAALFVGDRIDTDITGANRAGVDSALVMTGVSTRKELLGVKPEGRPTYILADLSELHADYVEAKKTKRGFSCGKAEVELLANRVIVSHGDPRSLDALKAACATIWSGEQPIYALDVEAALYE